MLSNLRRAFGTLLTRSLDAAGAGKRWAGASRVVNLNADMLTGATIAAQRAAYVARNNPNIAAAVNALVQRRGNRNQAALQAPRRRCARHAPRAVGALGTGGRRQRAGRVRAIQRIVGIQVDGVYGPATKAAVARWQVAQARRR